ncbi:MtrB/PioB family decaheme-associated outer membrane protein [Telmatospirillum sp.]|uniref:MtrB/PioB family decaheme-associated outer membrane protein n=1 Tax=Telmatospirillum sp. TaxID=2079197 RepID=UPI00284FD7FD|nr:MtrB/PioB family decaheme-associated outer membrane protein [Telmatospirillum sp.]MDR3437115.1 MtrB/PioB family decaheme-associated outer membrane protein [Telmatospirillum sp.]
MMVKNTLRAAALAGSCLLPLVAQAADFGDDTETTAAPDYANHLSVGSRYQSGTSALAGRYTGDVYKGFGAIGDLLVQGRDDRSSDKTGYYRIEADGLGIDSHLLLPDASISAKGGEQGLWGVSLFYNGIPHETSTTFHSLQNSSGGLTNGNPGSYATSGGIAPTAGSPSTTTVLSPAARALLTTNAAAVSKYSAASFVGTQRDQTGGEVTVLPFPNWTLTAGLQHEHKQGTKENSYSYGTANINYFPEPVDYDTDRYTATAAYNTKRLQAALSYVYSRFTDNATSFNGANPFVIGPKTAFGEFGTSGAVTGFTGLSSYALPPTNDAHMVKAQLGYNVSKKVRVNANFGYSLQEQTAVYASQFYNTSLPVSGNTGYTLGSNYNAKAENFFGNLAVSARPLDKVDLRASYTVDDHKNDSPHIYTNMSTDDNNGNIRPLANLPVSHLYQTVKLEGGYSILPETKITTGYVYSDKQRDFSVSDRNRENTLKAGLNSTLFSGVDAAVDYSHAVRTASNYSAQSAWLAANGTSATQLVTDNPQLKDYFQAARTRDEINGTLSWAISNTLTAGLNGVFYNDHFPNTYLGVTNEHTIGGGPDITYAPTKSLTTHFFYQFEEVFTDMNAATSTPSSTASWTKWQEGNKDTVHTVGTRTEWKVTPRLKLTLEDNLSSGNTAFQEASQIYNIGLATRATILNNTIIQIPDATTISNYLTARAQYDLADNVTLLGSYGFERTVSKDYLNWQTASNAYYTTNATTSLGGDGNPSYSIHVISAAIRVKW